MQRAEVDKVTGLPMMTKDLRALTLVAMKGLPGEPPSSNQIRRRLGAWFRGLLRAELGPIAPPVVDPNAPPVVDPNAPPVVAKPKKPKVHHPKSDVPY